MSNAYDMYAKLSGHEARAWIDSCVHNWTENGWFSSDIDAEELTSSILACKPVGFKNPRRARASKSSSSERSAAQYSVACVMLAFGPMDLAHNALARSLMASLSVLLIAKRQIRILALFVMA